MNTYIVMVMRASRLVITCLVGATGLIAASQAQATFDTPGQFNVTPTGAATYTVPIVVPPGTAGMVPSITLSYNSQGGSGMLGMGWGLGGLSAITRCGRTYIQDDFKDTVNYKASDKYCLDGQRLVAISGTYGANNTEYRTERESFTKIISYSTAGSGPAWFKAWTKAGQIVEYGKTADSRIEAQGKTDVRTWAINKLSDSVGNYLTVTYTEDNANGDYRPARIDYTGNAAASLTPYNSVRFVYPPTDRSDITPLYQAGSVIKTMKLLTNIKTFNGVDTLVKDYRLAYDTSAATQRSRLTSLTECAGDGTCLQPTTLTWLNGELSMLSKNQVSGVIDWGYPEGRAWADVNGDGKADFCRTVGGANHVSSYVKCTLSTVSGFGGTITSPVIDWGYPEGRAWADVNGDGKADFCRVVGGTNEVSSYVKCTLSTGSGFGGTVTSPVIDWGNLDGRAWADVNGDGKTDFCRTTGATNLVSSYVQCTLGGGGFEETITSPVIDWGYPEGRAWADVNGDGKADFCRIAGNEVSSYVKCTLSTGSGFGGTVTSPVIDWGNLDGRAWADVNGDGKTDFCRTTGATNNVSSYVQCTLSSSVFPDLLSDLTTGLGIYISPVYKPITDNSIYVKDSDAAYPYMDVQEPLYVVSSVSTSDGIGGTRSTNYKYYGAKVHLTGGGLLGFRKFEVTDTATGIKNATTFRQNYPFQGLPTELVQTQANGNVLHRVTNNWEYDTYPDTVLPIETAYGSKHHFSKLVASQEKTYELDGSLVTQVDTATTRFDSYGNAEIVTVGSTGGYSKTITNTYLNDIVNWYLGRLTSSVVSSTTP